MCDIRHKRIVRVGVREHRTDRKQHFRNGQCGTPLVPEDIKTDRAVRVDVRVVDLRREADLRRLERVVGGEGDGEEEDAARVR